MAFDTNSLFPVEALLSPVRHSTQPWLTWYSHSGERVELSGRVFDNWVAKTANLLSEEFDLAPGHVVATDMPAHWKSVALSMACWHVGATLRCVPAGTDPGNVNLFVTSAPQTMAVSGSVEVLVVPLPSLAMSFDGELPVGATDYAAEVRAYADFFFPSPIDTASIALSSGSADHSFRQLFVPSGTEGTTLVTTAWPLERMLPALIGLWANGVHVVLVEEDVTITDRLLSGERVVHRLDQQA